MATKANPASPPTNFYCPMHTQINQAVPGVCSKCGMDLVAQSARLGMLRHMLSMPKHMLRRPWLLVVMGAAMAIMAALMMR